MQAGKTSECFQDVGYRCDGTEILNKDRELIAQAQSDFIAERICRALTFLDLHDAQQDEDKPWKRHLCQ